MESWIEIPSYAAPIGQDGTEESLSQTSLRPPPSPQMKRAATSDGGDASRPRSNSSTRSALSGGLANSIITAALNVPTPSTPSDPRKTAGGRLLSTRDSLSIPITAVNFRRFVSKSGAVFWLQDRVEEIIFWRRGWKVTAAWMVAYSFFCYYPRLILLLPHVFLLSTLFVTYNIRYPADSKEDASPAPAWRPMESREASAEWFANLQAIQNLMGFYADLYDEVVPILPHLSHATLTSAPLLTLLIVTLVLSLPLLPLIPLRPTFLLLGWTPFVLTHPWTQRFLPPLVKAVRQLHHTYLQRLIDNDRLDDVVWSAPLKEVELWENERWSSTSGSSIASGEAGWSKSNLKRGERKGWSRRRDGWSDNEGLGGSLEGDVSSNLTFTLESGWHFVTTEDWRADLYGAWVPNVGADADGWVYTNDYWNEPRPDAPEEGKLRGMTRRRRWTRRIYYLDPQGKVGIQ